MIYEPSEDSFLLAKYVKKLAKGKVLDMGTGSGIQALAIKSASVLASDVDPEAVTHVQKHGIHTIQSDLFENVHETFDTIIFNPPYLPEDPLEDQESRLNTTGGKEGNELLKRFLQDAQAHLNPNGKILLVVSSLTKDAEQLFTHYSYEHKLLEEQKIAFETLRVYQLKKPSAEG